MTKLREMNIVDPTDDSKKLAVASDGTISAKISDGTNTVTVTGNKLDVNAYPLWNNANKVDVWDGTDDLQINSDGSLNITDNSGSLTVDQPTGTNLHVVVDSQTPGTGASNFGKAEDAAHTSGDVGVMALAVRNDTQAALATSNGDYIPLTTDELGNLRINISKISPGQTDLWQQRVYDGFGFVVSTDFLQISSTSETDFAIFKNPSGSGKLVRIKRIDVGMVATVTGDGARLRIYRDPTVTSNGSSKTSVKIRKSQSTSATLLAYSAPTISARGTLMTTWAVAQGAQVSADANLNFYIEENETLLFSLDPENTGKYYCITLYFEEE